MKLVLNCKKVASLICSEDVIDVGRSDSYTVVSCSGHEDGNIGHVILDLANTATCHVLVLTSRHVSTVKLEAEDCRSNVYSLMTKTWDSPAPSCPGLPQPNFVSGLVASLMTQAQMIGGRMAAILVISEILSVDSLSLEPFTVIHKLGLHLHNIIFTEGILIMFLFCRFCTKGRNQITKEHCRRA